ncbi:hypothetical protein [Luteibacter sp.]|jgi:hypothetical protein|uniref:hypothetical protein n=1 Tax=Luteibacter sp. TaxID=1886636 RepID=UPI002F3E549D
MVRLSCIAVAILSLAAAAHKLPAPAAMVTCSDERFVAGERLLPSYDEAFLQCREEEHQMTHPDTGDFEKQRACYEVSKPGEYGEWRYGRIAMDVVERHSGDAYTFETLWMCKRS